MATTFELTLSCEPSRAAQALEILNCAHERIAELERELSEFLPASPISKLNAAAPGTRVRVSPAAITLLKLSERLHRRTSGRFDVTAKSENQAARVEWDERTCEAWTCAPATRLGFGAIGKGYALDEIRAMIERAGFTDYLLSGGGSSIVVSGFADGPTRPWLIGWSWTRDSAGRAQGVSLSHETGKAIAIGVSGAQEQGAHIFDPRTQAGPLYTQPQALSVWVAHTSAAEADALSTALFVEASGQANWSFLDGEGSSMPAVAILDPLCIPKWNRGFQNLWGPLAATATAFALTLAVTASRAVWADDAAESVDLNQLATEGAVKNGAPTFTPYIFERNSWAIALPVFALLLVLLHLKKYPAVRRKILSPQSVPNGPNTPTHPQPDSLKGRTP